VFYCVFLVISELIACKFIRLNVAGNVVYMFVYPAHVTCSARLAVPRPTGRFRLAAILLLLYFYGSALGGQKPRLGS